MLQGEYLVETRKKILFEAFKLFLSRGYRNVSLNDVVHTVGVTKGGFYHYFKSKDELYIEVINTYFFSLFDRYMEMLQPSRGSVKERLWSVFSEIYAVYDEMIALVGEENFRGMTAILFSGLKRFDFILRRLKELYTEIMDALERIIEEGKKRGELRREVDAHASAFGAIALGEGTMILWIINLDGGRKDLPKRLFENYWRGIAA